MSNRSIDCLPQIGPARLITGIREVNGEFHCTARLPEDSPLRGSSYEAAEKDESVPAAVAIEMAAQATAVLQPQKEELSSDESTNASPRFLVGVRAVKFAATRIAANDEYHCRATLTTQSGPLRIYRFEVSKDSGEAVADGELSTFFDSGATPS